MIYLATPYTHEVPGVRHLRYRQACSVAADLMRDGKHIFSPVAHSHGVAVAGGLPDHFEFWRAWGRWFLERCDEVLVAKLDGWEQSRGIAAEIELAQQLGKPVEYYEI